MLRGTVRESKEDIGRRLRTILRKGAPGLRSADLEDAITDGCARALVIEAENLRLGERISELAMTADDPTNAKELRRLWLRRRTLSAELRELREILRQLSTSRPRARAS